MAQGERRQLILNDDFPFMLSLSKHAEPFSVRIGDVGIGHPEVLEGLPRRARRDTSAQSPRISASFLFRPQPLICRSQDKASSRVGNCSEKINFTGSLVEVYPWISPV
jgi:hypothetical protein